MAEEATPMTWSAARMLMDTSFLLANDLLGGVAEMRRAGTRRLPIHGEEEDDCYEDRLGKAVLFNYFRQAVLQLGGRPFREPVTLHVPLPPELKDFEKNVDRRGSTLTSFGEKLFRDALSKGMAMYLVDFPAMADEVETLEDERRLNLRPYFVHVHPDNLISARAEILPSGEERFTHVRILEIVTIPDPENEFAEIEVTRVRVYEPEGWRLLEQRGKGDKLKDWVEIDRGVNTLGKIPLVVYYADRTDFMMSRPPLEDLAYLNVAHWQSGSEQQHVLTVTRFPILAATGVDDKDTLIIGPNKWLRMDNPNAKAFYVEHTGAAIEAGRQDLRDREERMAVLSVDLLIRRAQDRASATGRNIDDTRTGSFLLSMALDFSNFLAMGLELAAEWMSVTYEANVEVASDFDLSANDAAALQTLVASRATGDISRETFLGELKRRNILPDIFDVAEEEVRLAKEGPLPGVEPPTGGDDEDEDEDEDENAEE